MRYTTLRVAPEGVVLFRAHEGRLAPEGPAVVRAYREFARSARPGNYALRAHDRRLEIADRGPSLLRNGMPVRFAVSPFLHETGRFAKPAPPSPYDGVRMAGICTVLTNPSGDEWLETCTAALVGWRNDRFVVAPDDRPRVFSLAEEAIRAHLRPLVEPLRADDRMPLAAVNAVAGVCVPALGRPGFPTAACEEIEALFAALTSRE